MTPKQRNACRRRTVNKGPRHKRGKLWQAARILREFTCAELGAVCEQENLQSVRNYICQLTRAGYFIVVGKGFPRRYRLIRNTGPVPPHFVHNHAAFYDPNTDQEYPYGPQQ